MKYRKATLMACGAAFCVTVLAAVLILQEFHASNTASLENPQNCDSCTLRHHALGKSQEALDKERAKLRELYEQSKAGLSQE